MLVERIRDVASCDVQQVLPWRRIAAVSVGLALLAGCRAPLADDLPRPIAAGRADDGRIRFVVPLCAGEEIAALEVLDHQTARPVWKVSQPVRAEEEKGLIILGDAQGFAKEENALREPVPNNISVGAELVGGLHVGSGITLDKVPADFAGTDRVLSLSAGSTEEEFRRQVDAEYC